MFKKLRVASAICLATASQSYAQSIWTNPITGTNPNTSNPYTTGQTVVSNLTVSGIGRGTGIVGTNTNDRYNAINWSTGALDTNDYFTFTLTPNAGFGINLTNFVYTAQASGTGPVSAVFRSSLDGFVANIGSATVTGATIDLSGTAYQGITTSTEFRLYEFGASGSTGTFSINDFTFNGAVVPEPSSIALIGLGLAGAVVLRRRSK